MAVSIKIPFLVISPVGVRLYVDVLCRSLRNLVMATYGSLTCWWRVMYADGSLPPGHEDRAAELLRAEGVPLRGGRVEMRRARWSGPATDGVTAT